MAIINTEITHEFDLLDEQFVNAICSSGTKLIEKYLSFNSDDTVKRTQDLQKFWPHLIKKTKGEIESGEFRICILPLNRVEASEGASGSKVFVAYFILEDGSDDYSNPVVLKLRDKRWDSSYDKLKYEKEKGDELSRYVRDKGEYFIFPDFNDEHENTRILWAFFSSAVFSYPEVGQKKPILKEDNLWKSFDELKLDCRDEDLKNKIRKGIQDSYEAVSVFHMKDKYKREERNLADEYRWYLRDEKWKEGWEYVWGNGKQKEILDLGQKWINPLYVFENLSKCEANITVGAIHGDLHTKNILFVPSQAIRIIDFGWGNDNGHIAKDFLLMESNLRFMILHPDVPYDDLVKLTSTLSQPELKHVDYQCEYSKFIHELISEIRNRAFGPLSKDKVYEEYLIPLFLISLGLLEFSKTFNNIISAKLTILKLAEMIDGYLKDKT